MQLKLFPGGKEITQGLQSIFTVFIIFPSVSRTLRSHKLLRKTSQVVVFFSLFELTVNITCDVFRRYFWLQTKFLSQKAKLQRRWLLLEALHASTIDKWSLFRDQIRRTIYEGLQAEVEQSTFRSSGLRPLLSPTWLRKTTQEVASIGSVTEYIDAISCVSFEKPCLASQRSRAQRTNCGWLHYRCNI